MGKTTPVGHKWLPVHFPMLFLRLRSDLLWQSQHFPQKDLYLAEASNCDAFSVTITANILSTVCYVQDKQYKDTLPLSFGPIPFVLETGYSLLFFPCSV